MWLLPVDLTRSASPTHEAVAAALLSTAEVAGRPGMLTKEDGTQKEGAILRCLCLPVRQSGGGIRSRLELAPATYCALVVEAMERFLPTAGSTGFWAVLEPVFGAGAFAGIAIAVAGHAIARGHVLLPRVDALPGWGARHRRARPAR